MVAVIPSEEQVIEWITSLSNWGRWGEEDQAGCLNLITPAKRQQAATLIHDGTTVSCARPITTEITPDITYQVQRYMVDSGEGRDTDSSERRRVRRGAAEFIGMVFHGQTLHILMPYRIIPGRARCITASPPVSSPHGRAPNRTRSKSPPMGLSPVESCSTFRRCGASPGFPLTSR